MLVANLKLPEKLLRLGTPMVHLVAAALCLVTFYGCAGNYLGSLATKSPSTWSIFVEPRDPDGPLEEAIVLAARTGQDVALEWYDCFYISDKAASQYVDLVEKVWDENRFAEKYVTRYRVSEGKIAAHTCSATEIYPDVNFEKAALRCASMAKGISPVLLYNDDIHPVTMASRPLGFCAAEVRIYDGFETRGKPMAKKIINFCSTPDGQAL